MSEIYLIKVEQLLEILFISLENFRIEVNIFILLMTFQEVYVLN